MKCGVRTCLAGVTLALVFATGCKDENPITGDSPSNIVFPASNVSYGEHVEPLFFQTCALVGCHDDSPHESALKLTSWTNLMHGSLRVVEPGLPDASVLVWRIEGRVGVRMPRNRGPLNQNQVNGIRAWVAEGAKNN